MPRDKNNLITLEKGFEMVIEPPWFRSRKRKIMLELALLKMKEKFLGDLNEKDKEKQRKLLQELSIKF